MTPRLYNADDVPGILRIWNQTIRETLATFRAVTFSAEQLADLLEGRAKAGFATFVVGDGQVDGFVTYAQFRGGDGYRHTTEHTILLDAAAQGQGAGRALMAAMEDHARAKGIHSNFAVVSSANPGAVTFHERLGYVEQCVLPEVGRKWDQWLDAHILQKRLSGPGPAE